MWVCKKCETENNDCVDYCFICKAWRFEFEGNNQFYNEKANIADEVKLESLDGKDYVKINSSSLLEENDSPFNIAVENNDEKYIKEPQKSFDVLKFVIVAANVLLFAFIVYFIFLS